MDFWNVHYFVIAIFWATVIEANNGIVFIAIITSFCLKVFTELQLLGNSVHEKKQQKKKTAECKFT